MYRTCTYTCTMQIYVNIHTVIPSDMVSIQAHGKNMSILADWPSDSYPILRPYSGEKENIF